MSIFLLTFLLTTPILSTTYYIDPVVGNDDNPGTSYLPWQTIEKARSAIHSGDTVILGPGEYGPWKWVNFENTGDDITFVAQDPENPPIFTCIHLTGTTGISLSNHLIIDGVHVIPGINSWEVASIQKWACSINLSYASDVQFKNCTIRGTLPDVADPFTTDYYSAWEPGKAYAQGDLVYVYDSRGEGFAHLYICHAAHTSAADTEPQTGENWSSGWSYVLECVRIQSPKDQNILFDHCDISHGQSGICASNIKNATFTHNNIYYIFGDLFEICGLDGALIEGNHIHTALEKGPEFGAIIHSDMMAIYSWSHPSYYPARNLVIRNNILNGDAQGFFFKHAHNILIENNLVYGPLTAHACTLHVSCGSAVIRNNTFATTAANSISLYMNKQEWPNSITDFQPGIIVSVTIGDEQSSYMCIKRHDADEAVNKPGYGSNWREYWEEYEIVFDIYNNIVARACVISNTAYGDVLNMYNNVFALAATYSHVVDPSNYIYGHELSAAELDALFVNPAAGDFRPEPTGRLTNGGTDANYTTIDFDGKYRIDTPDIGCYEHMNTPADTTAPTTPQNPAAQLAGQNQVDLTWAPSVDADSGINLYLIYRNGNEVPIARVADTSYADTGLLPDTLYSYTIAAVNNAGLQSTPSSAVQMATSSSNQPPTANAGDDQVLTDEDENGSEPVFLNGTASSDPDNNITNYTWKEGQTTIAASVNPVVNLTTGTHIITLTVTDSMGAFDTDTVSVTVNEASAPPNQAPVALSDAFTVIENSANNNLNVLINDNDPDGNPLTISETTSPQHGSINIISDDTLLAYTPTAGYYGQDSFSYTISDGQGGFDSASATVTINEHNLDPIAHAGIDQTIDDNDSNGTEAVTLNASSSSDPDGTIVSYSWKEGATPLLGSPNPVGIIQLPVGTHIITLTVTDNDDATDTDTVTITINEQQSNTPPETFTSAYELEEDNPLPITTLASDADDDPLTYFLVTQPQHGQLSGEAPSLIYVPQQNYFGSDSFRFRVYDGQEYSNTSTIDLTITSVNDPPVADHGADQPNLIDTDYDGLVQVTLDGSASYDIDGTITSWSWAGAPVAIPSVAKPTITLPIGQHTISLTVTDNEGASHTANGVTIIISGPLNQPPIANAGDDQTWTDDDNDGVVPVTLNGSASTDLDNNIQEYTWYEDSQLIATGMEVTVNAPLGLHDYMLKVTDLQGLYSTDAVQVNILTGNQPPVAIAGTNQSITDTDGNGYELITLDASASQDPDGTIDSYTWTHNSQVIATGIHPQISLPVGNHTITLTVTDNAGAAADDSIMIAVQESEIPNYVIAASVSEYGSIQPAGDIILQQGQDQTFTLTPDQNCHIVDLLVNNLSVGSLSSYTFSNISDDQTIQVVFAPDLQAESDDQTAPSLTNCSPAPQAVQIPLNTLISLHITDIESGIDPNSITIRVNEQLVYFGNTDVCLTEHARTGRKGSMADYSFICQPACPFDYDQPVTVSVSACDRAGNSMPPGFYTFRTQMRSFGNDTIVYESLAPEQKQEYSTTVIDSFGNIWLASQNGPAGSRNITMARKSHDSDSFDLPVVIDAQPCDQIHPKIAINSDNQLLAVWQDNRNGNWDIFVSSSPNGIEWTKPIAVIDSPADQTHPTLAVNDSNATAYIAWQDQRNVNWDIYLASSGNGFNQKEYKQITSNSYDQTEPALALDADGNAYLLWTDTRNNSSDIYGAASTDSWTNTPVVTGPAEQSSPVLACEQQGDTLHLLWVCQTNGDKNIYYANTAPGLPDQAIEGTSIIDDTSGADQSQPSLVVSGYTGDSVKLFACWKDQRNTFDNNGDDDIYFCETQTAGSAAQLRFGTNLWLASGDMENIAQTQPLLRLTASGLPFVFWTQAASDSNSEIHMAASTDMYTQILHRGAVSASTGGIVGCEPSVINSADDISLQVPPSAFWDDVNITISRVKNTPSESVPLNSIAVIASYEFGPSCPMEFYRPVTITIPYNSSETTGNESVYWYNPQTGQYSQQGISNIEILTLSSTLSAIRYTTTHFTEYVIGQEEQEDPHVTLSASSGGGCSLSAYSNRTLANSIHLIVPYALLITIALILKIRAAMRLRALHCKQKK